MALRYSSFECVTVLITCLCITYHSSVTNILKGASEIMGQFTKNSIFNVAVWNKCHSSCWQPDCSQTHRETYFHSHVFFLKKENFSPIHSSRNYYQEMCNIKHETSSFRWLSQMVHAALLHLLLGKTGVNERWTWFICMHCKSSVPVVKDEPWFFMSM